MECYIITPAIDHFQNKTKETAVERIEPQLF